MRVWIGWASVVAVLALVAAAVFGPRRESGPESPGQRTEETRDGAASDGSGALRGESLPDGGLASGGDSSSLVSREAASRGADPSTANPLGPLDRWLRGEEGSEAALARYLATDRGKAAARHAFAHRLVEWIPERLADLWPGVEWRDALRQIEHVDLRFSSDGRWEIATEGRDGERREAEGVSADGAIDRLASVVHRAGAETFTLPEEPSLVFIVEPVGTSLRCVLESH